MKANEARGAVIAKYAEILGRNHYSQARRDYCYRKYSDGRYYSDCSSSISYAYREAGMDFGILNTVGMYQSKKLVDVNVEIKNGVIQNPEALRIGDMLLFAGGDSKRSYAGYVGHVEMVYKISGSTVTLCGHGSGTPRLIEMNKYCKSRYSKKANTKLGHRGLIRVRRFIADDAEAAPIETGSTKVQITGSTVNLRTGPGTKYTPIHVAEKGDTFDLPDATGWTPICYGGHVYWVSDKYSEIRRT